MSDYAMLNEFDWYVEGVVLYENKGKQEKNLVDFYSVNVIAGAGGDRTAYVWKNACISPQLY